MNKERLLRLADHLETVKDAKFDLETWLTKNACGFVACAVGHACDIPEFKEAGLRMEPRNENYFPVYQPPAPNRDYPMCERYVNWDAVREFFDLDRRESLALFSDDHYLKDARSRTDVIARIRAFVAADDKEHARLVSMAVEK